MNLTEKISIDEFDPFFPNNRKGWFQKGDAYINRKLLIDSLFGNENVKGYSDIVKLSAFLREHVIQTEPFKQTVQPCTIPISTRHYTVVFFNKF